MPESPVVREISRNIVADVAETTALLIRYETYGVTSMVLITVAKTIKDMMMAT